MAKADGFRVMDVATDIHKDRKFGRIERMQPGLAQPAFVVYLALMAESWSEARRLTLDEAWPALVAWDPAIVQAMTEVRLVDPDGRIPKAVWAGWFERTRERRDHNRDRWRRSKQRVREDSARSHGGVHASSPVSVRPSVVPSSTRTERTETRVRAEGLDA